MLVGADELADELAATDDHVAAFARYQDRMREYVVENQKVALRVSEDHTQITPETMRQVSNLVTL